MQFHLVDCLESGLRARISRVYYQLNDSDFIYAVICEEFGMIFAVGINDNILLIIL